ncbi:hypothetical protein HanPSC8_Chr15g0683371 [Helianthus annuus]|nr:hypothetical protein HanPSC8_Chr15g0683371 [Helianthus annuus]
MKKSSTPNIQNPHSSNNHTPLLPLGSLHPSRLPKPINRPTTDDGFFGETP